MTDLDELKKLAPEARLAKIKEQQEKRKKESEEAEGLIQESMDELERNKIAKSIPAPEQKDVDITKLFETEEPESIERALRGKKTDEPPAEVRYSLNQHEANDLYNNLIGLRERRTDLWEREEREAFYQIEARLSRVKDSYLPSDEVADTVITSRQIIKQLRGYLR